MIISLSTRCELTTIVVIDQISSVEQNSAWNDTSSEEVPNLEIGSQDVLRLLVDLRLIFRDLWWVEKVEERVVRHLLGNGANGSASLVLLLLLDGLHRDVLAGLPVDVAAVALVDLWAFERERLLAVDLTAQVVFLREDRIREVVVWCEVEFQGVRQVFVILDLDVRERLQQRLVVSLDHVAQQLRVAEDCEPEIGNSCRMNHEILLLFSLLGPHVSQLTNL